MASVENIAKRRILMQNNLTDGVREAYLKAFRRAASASYGSGMPPTFFEFKKSLILDAEINIIIDALVADIYKLILRYSGMGADLAAEKNETEEPSDYLPFVFRDIKGKNIEDRMTGYKEDAKYEFEAIIAASMLLKKPIGSIVSEFSQYVTTPYSSPSFKSVISGKEKYLFSAKMLLRKGVVYGQSGKYNSALNSFKRLSESSVADAFGFADLDYMQRRGAIGYFANRGSSYPCQICDDNVGFHPIGEMTLPVHSRCMCYSTPVFAGDL